MGCNAGGPRTSTRPLAAVGRKFMFWTGCQSKHCLRANHTDAHPQVLMLAPPLHLQIAEDKRRGLDAAETMAAVVTFETEAVLQAALSLFPHRKPGQKGLGM